MNQIIGGNGHTIRAIIFDLDNCLAAADEMGRSFFEPGFAAIRRANDGAVSEEDLVRAFEDSWRIPLDFVAEKYGFSDTMLSAGWEVFAKLEVQTPMYGYGDLDVLDQLPVARFLVTSGFRRLQESKIRALGFAPTFRTTKVDAIDEPGRKGKHGLFSEILESEQLRPDEALVVGDNPDSEIAAGNRLGMPTVQILRPGVSRGDNAGYYVEGLAELKRRLVS